MMIERKYMLILLITTGVGAGIYGLLYPFITGEIRGQRRQAALAGAGSDRKVERGVDPVKRRRAITESLKEVEESNKSASVSMEQRIAQAGVEWSSPIFYALSVVCGIIAAFPFYLITGNLLIAVVVLVVCAFALPRGALSYLRKRRINKFVEYFPEALDVIIRGVKAGLPLGECFRLIANEGQEPVRSEFKTIVDAQAVGITLGDAIERFAQRVPVAEASFFAIVISLQQKTGGNLSEALSNLARVLRERKKLKAKVKAVSAEAKASAGIIGSLPFLVGGAVTFLNPDYMSLLYMTTPGHMVLGGGLLWMATGVFIMYKMINFDI